MLNVNNMRIYELRDFARKVGVKSPTSKTKGQLIKEIGLIKSGQMQPYKTKKGRKPLSSFALDEKNKEFLTTELKKLNKTLEKNIKALIQKINT